MKLSSSLRGAAGLVALTLAVLSATTAAPAQADVRNPWWFEKMRVAQAHEVTEGEGARVCVIDSSINPDIPELQGADLRLAGGTKPYPKSGWAGHGTAMVTLIVGQGQGTVGGRGITGIAPKARVDFYGVTTEPYADTDIQYVDIGLEKAVADGCKVISVSIASQSDLDYDTQVAAAQKAGAIVVAGGGVAGSGPIGYPAGNRGAVAVGAVDSNGRTWTRQPAQTEGYLSISAPGIKVPVGGTVGPPRNATWDSSIERTGTSPATPLVAASLAMAWSQWPDATANQMIQSLVHTTNGPDGNAKWDYSRQAGYGIVNLTRMLEQDPTGWPDENPLLLSPAKALKAYPLSIYDTTPEPTPSASAASKQADADTNGSGLPLLPLGIAVAALLVIVGAAATILRRRTRLSDPTREDR